MSRLLLAAVMMAIALSVQGRAQAEPPPFAHETLGVGNGCFVESVCLYDQFHEIFGPEAWVRVLQWGANENDPGAAGHAVAVFELKGQLWAWDINFGFLPLDVPPDRKEDVAQVASPIVARYPDVTPKFLYYRYDSPLQAPEKNGPEVRATSEVSAVRDATLAGARLAAHRPVNVVQFSSVDPGGKTQPSAATVFFFNGQVCVYFPERGTVPFVLPYHTIFNLAQLQRAFRCVYPGAFALKSLNHPAPETARAAPQN